MNIYAKHLRLMFLLVFLFGHISCFAADCGETKKYSQCLVNYIDNLPPSAISPAAFHKKMIEAKRQAESLPGGASNQNVTTILSGLNELITASKPHPDRLSFNQWKLEEGLEVGGIPFTILATNKCDSETPASNKACEETYQRAILYASFIHQIGAAVNQYNTEARQGMHAEYVAREERWHSYLYDTQFQYAWELMANRYIDVNIRDSKRDAFKNLIESREPPRNKGIFLHPDIGLQYIRSQPQGQQIKPALIFQWIGYQQWTWTGNYVSDIRGISLASTISDNASASRMGWGIQLQYDDYAVALTSHNGVVAVTLNLKLIDRMSTLNNGSVQELQAQIQ